MIVDFVEVADHALTRAIRSADPMGRWKFGGVGSHTYTNSAFDPMDCNNALSAFRSLARCEFTRKYLGTDPSLAKQRELAALRSFVEGEADCRDTNARLRSSTIGPSPALKRVILHAQKTIRRIIGDAPDVAAILRDCAHGPGVTVQFNRTEASLENKTMKLFCSGSAQPYLRALVKRSPLYLTALGGVPIDGPADLLDWPIGVGNPDAVITVRKNATSDRTIAKTNGGQMLLQKGTDAYLKRRMLLHYPNHLDLRDQGNNQRAAATAVKRRLATVDLSNASNLNATMMVKLLFPSDWFRLLSDIRATEWSIQSQHPVTPSDLGAPLEGSYEMIGAMGNGFTFSVMTLMLFAITTAVTHEFHSKIPFGDCDEVWVYGDDIICSEHIVPELQQALAVFGHRLNSAKSHWQPGNRYRESCGEHYFDNVNITPVYQKRTVVVPFTPQAVKRLKRQDMYDNGWQTELISLLNRLYSLAVKDQELCGLYNAKPALHKAWLEVYKLVHFYSRTSGFAGKALRAVLSTQSHRWRPGDNFLVVPPSFDESGVIRKGTRVKLVYLTRAPAATPKHRNNAERSRDEIPEELRADFGQYVYAMLLREATGQTTDWDGLLVRRPVQSSVRLRSSQLDLWQVVELRYKYYSVA